MNDNIKKQMHNGPISDESGYTLLEIMVVVMIISLLMGAVAVVAWKQFGRAQEKITAQTVQGVVGFVEQYALNHDNECPLDFKDLITDQIIDSPPKDAWGEELLFKCPAEHGVRFADVWSKGPDKLEGNEDDICSWKLKK